MSEVADAIETMKRARHQIRDLMRVEKELRARIENQWSIISVARGYIQESRPDLAALVLENDGGVSCMEKANRKRGNN